MHFSQVAAHIENSFFPRSAAFGVSACFASIGMVLHRSARNTRVSDRKSQARRVAAVDEPEPLEFEVTPWAGIEPRPIYAVSGSTGGLARHLVEAAWCQFGFAEEAQLTVCPGVLTAAEVDAVVEEVSAACEDTGAFIIFSLASPELCSRMTEACAAKRNISCIDALGPLLITLEETLKQSRLERASDEDAAAAGARADSPPQSPLSVYAVSDSTGSVALESVRRGISHFATSGIKEVTLCPEVRSVEEIRLIAEAAGQENGLVVFTFASSGMSRFMRQRCEMEGARFLDLYQPIILALEIYLDYPSIGVPGGYVGSDGIAAMKQKWSRKQVT